MSEIQNIQTFRTSRKSKAIKFQPNIKLTMQNPTDSEANERIAPEKKYKKKPHIHPRTKRDKKRNMTKQRMEKIEGERERRKRNYNDDE